MSASAARFGGVHFVHRAEVAARQHQGLERPHRPERRQRDEALVLAHERARARRARARDSRTAAAGRAPRDRRAARRVSFTASLGRLSVAQIWPCGCGLLAPIDRAAVLENLHRADVVARAERAVLARSRLRPPARSRRRSCAPASGRGAAKSRRPADAALRLGDDQAALVESLRPARRSCRAGKSLANTSVVRVGRIDARRWRASCRGRDSSRGRRRARSAARRAFRSGPARGAGCGAATPAPIRRVSGLKRRWEVSLQQRHGVRSSLRQPPRRGGLVATPAPAPGRQTRNRRRDPGRLLIGAADLAAKRVDRVGLAPG